jgi:hypothetical protein
MNRSILISTLLFLFLFSLKNEVHANEELEEAKAVYYQLEKYSRQKVTANIKQTQQMVMKRFSVTSEDEGIAAFHYQAEYQRLMDYMYCYEAEGGHSKIPEGAYKATNQIMVCQSRRNFLTSDMRSFINEHLPLDGIARQSG